MFTGKQRELIADCFTLAGFASDKSQASSRASDKNCEHVPSQQTVNKNHL